jgi:hypothetical protein
MNEEFEWIEFLVKLLSVIIPLTIATIYAVKDFKKVSENKLNLAGYVVITLLIFSLFLGIWDYFNSIENENKSEAKIQKALEKRDSINQFKNEKANKLLFESFAKYGLKYDLAKQEIERLVKDSARINYITAEKPYFYIYAIEKISSNNNNLKLKLTFTSKSTSYNIKTTLDLIEYDTISNKLNLIEKNYPTLAYGAEMPEKAVSSIEIPFENISNKVPIIFFRLKGTYENSEKKKIKVDKIYGYHKVKGFVEPKTIFQNLVQEFIATEKI